MDVSHAPQCLCAAPVVPSTSCKTSRISEEGEQAGSISFRILDSDEWNTQPHDARDGYPGSRTRIPTPVPFRTTRNGIPSKQRVDEHLIIEKDSSLIQCTYLPALPSLDPTNPYHTLHLRTSLPSSTQHPAQHPPASHDQHLRPSLQCDRPLRGTATGSQGWGVAGRGVLEPVWNGDRGYGLTRCLDFQVVQSHRCWF
ncbi:hypothetical protein P152DRAFT_216411 [Eremomyces bilateralis CBS 781.70]|uniref:Uncharacterized protein n=1 Tax=Eremomyces bilateralis CBS 781.70 TaxID=1392243 RepID=A0A6G1FRY2_9PEZI|nr:uncharacterized protein P152DRAFT_216411 [Eremomyces bilateralis CBS 781.70]KAF1808544.1 hypothetical protein P152DRAFT_216411 [Eremomyces bilateralis CBS 781.70]